MNTQGFRTSLAGRGFIALVLFVGYYVLAIAVAGLLCLVPVAIVKLTGRIHWLAFIFFGAAALVLWSVVPRPQWFKAPGPRLTPGSDPRLFEEIFRLARELGQRAPREAYLMPGVTAWVSERGGFMGFGRRRIVGLGLALLEVISVSEFKAVLAHEFAHFRRGDTRLGPWIFRTRSTIGRTLQELPALSGFGKTAAAIGALIQRPFVLYGNWFLRITQAISRRQEYLADELSAETSGRETTVSTLRKIYMADVAFQMYWNTVLGKALNAGLLPPYAAGFGQFAEFEPNKDLVRKALSWHIEHVQSEPHDSHPSLGERLKALEALPAGREPEAAPPAISLLGDVPGRERALFAFINPEAGSKLKPADWDDVTEAVLIPNWAGIAKTHQADLEGVTPRSLPDRLPELAEWGRRMCLASGQPLVEEHAEDQSRTYASGVIAVAIVTKMIERGWRAAGGPGQYTVLSLDERSWEPFRCVYALAGGEMTVDEWLKLCDELGIGDLELVSGEPAPREEPLPQQNGLSASAEETPPASGGRQDAPAILSVMIGLVMVAIVASIYRLQPWNYANSISAVPPYQGINFNLSPNGPDLVAKVTQESSDAASHTVRGNVSNRSAKSYHLVIVKVEFCNAAGQVVSTLTTEVRGKPYLPPGGVTPFTVRAAGRLLYATVQASVVYAMEQK